MKKHFVFIPLLLLSYFLRAQPCPAITGFSMTSPSCFGLCNGSIEINYTSGTPPYTIVWSSPLSQTIVTSSLTQSITGVCAGTYSATVTDNTGCSTSQPVNLSQPSNLNLLSSPNNTICYGQTTQVAASGSGGTSPYSYSWSPSPFTGGGPHMVSPTNATSYTVSISDANGCTVAPKVITLNVMPPLSVVGSSITICDGGTTVLTPYITSPGSGGPYSFTWNNSANTGTISVVGNASSNPTIYTVNVSDGCTMPQAATSFTVVAQVCSGVNELERSSLSVFPNPSNETLTISDHNIICKIELSDLSGKILVSEKLSGHSYQLQLHEFSEGIYFVKIFYDNGMSVAKKMVVDR